MASTSTILSHSQTVYRAKKRAKQNQIKEVVFDDDARTFVLVPRTPSYTQYSRIDSEFLTGFHKRKLQRTEEKRNKAIERDKQQRLEARREVRAQRPHLSTARFTVHCSHARRGRNRLRRTQQQSKERWVQMSVRTSSVFISAPRFTAVLDTDDEDDRPRPSAKHIEDEMEFEDEELLATVTVVEDFTTDDLILGPSATRRSAADVDPSSPKPAPKSRLQLERAPSTSSSAPKPKAKDPKFRYETKAGRKATKEKQKVRRAFKATAARPSSSNKKPTQTSKRRR